VRRSPAVSVTESDESSALVRLATLAARLSCWGLVEEDKPGVRREPSGAAADVGLDGIPIRDEVEAVRGRRSHRSQ
jgi:hypothetical protein